MSFRLVVWNCNMALHAKHERLLSLRPDVAVVPECAEPDILRRKAPDFRFADCEWRGSGKDKGLGVFTFGDLRLRLHQSWEPRFHLFLPVEVRGPATFNLLAVWAFSTRAPERVAPNPATTAAAVAHYAPFLAAAPAVVAGDFNASVFWDASKRYESFAGLDASLGALGLVSAYHAAGGHALGAEPAPTLFWQKKVTQPFHIDYAYIPRAWTSRVREASIGGAGEWLAHSDHAPLVVEVAGDA
jgi:exodeoxyribonuclease-3